MEALLARSDKYCQIMQCFMVKVDAPLVLQIRSYGVTQRRLWYIGRYACTTRTFIIQTQIWRRTLARLIIACNYENTNESLRYRVDGPRERPGEGEAGCGPSLSAKDRSAAKANWSFARGIGIQNMARSCRWISKLNVIFTQVRTFINDFEPAKLIACLPGINIVLFTTKGLRTKFSLPLFHFFVIKICYTSIKTSSIPMTFS